MLGYGQKDIEPHGKDTQARRPKAILWPNLGPNPDDHSTQAFIKPSAQKYTNLGRMLELVTGEAGGQNRIDRMSDNEIREILDAAPKSPVLVIPKASNAAQKLDGRRIWIASREASGEWSFINPLEKEKARITLKMDEFKELAEEIAYLKDHKALEL
jgi:hypothetical protein